MPRLAKYAKILFDNFGTLGGVNSQTPLTSQMSRATTYVHSLCSFRKLSAH